MAAAPGGIVSAPFGKVLRGIGGDDEPLSGIRGGRLLQRCEEGARGVRDQITGHWCVELDTCPQDVRNDHIKVARRRRRECSAWARLEPAVTGRVAIAELSSLSSDFPFSRAAISLGCIRLMHLRDIQVERRNDDASRPEKLPIVKRRISARPAPREGAIGHVAVPAKVAEHREENLLRHRVTK